MNIDVTGHHVDVTQAMRAYVGDKLTRIERHFDSVNKAHVILSVEKLIHKAEATVSMPGSNPVFAEAQDSNMYAAIDALTDKIDRIANKRRAKVIDHHNREARRGEVHMAVE